MKVSPVSDARFFSFIPSLDLQVSAMEIRRICRVGTGVFDPLLEDGGNDLSSTSGDGGTSRLLGSLGFD